MTRKLQPELLDLLPPQDRGAIRSRQDLYRLNLLMAHPRLVHEALLTAGSPQTPARLVELGAGDGRFALRLAGLLVERWPSLRAILVDRLAIVEDRTRQGFAQLGWPCETICADIFEWLDQAAVEPGDWIVANLFLHHFADHDLRRLLEMVAARCTIFVACEPRRAPGVLMFSWLVRLIGCNSVTRHDAAASVRAGFRHRELTDLWPRRRTWRATEREAGRFSHLFVATSEGHPSRKD
jgi:hypothetical protein